MSKVKIKNYSQVISVPSRIENEDKAIVKEKLYCVLDGASGLSSKKTEFTAKRFVNDFANRLETASSKNTNLLDLIYKINSEIQSKYSRDESYRLLEDYEKPTSGLSALIIRDDFIEIATLGDCKILMLHADGTLQEYSDQTILNSLDQNVLTFATDNNIFTNNIKSDPILLQILRKNRSLANKANGYSILGHGLRLNKIKHFKIPLTSMEFIILSDGFDRITQVFHKYDYRSLFMKVRNLGLATIVNEIRELERADKNCVDFPRLKTSDDCSAIYVELRVEGLN